MPGQRETGATRGERILKARTRRRSVRGSMVRAVAGRARLMAGQSSANEEGSVAAVTPAGVTASAVSLLIGFPVQAMIDPGTLDPREHLAVIHGTLGRPGIAA